jgi:quinol monooxygenase YgiN
MQAAEQPAESDAIAVTDACSVFVNPIMSGSALPVCRARRRSKMPKLSLFVRLEAKPGKEADVAAFLMQGLELARQEATTPVWFALRMGPSTFGVFDAFEDEAGRQAHLTGPIAQALMAQAPNLLASPPAIERVEVLGAKLPKSV